MLIETKNITTRLGRNYTVIDDPNFIKRHFWDLSQQQHLSDKQFKILKKIRPHYNLIVDVGANWGMNTIEYAHMSHNVVSFEPYPSLYKLLVKNIKQNGCEITSQIISICFTSQ